MTINTFVKKEKLCITLDPNSGTNVVPIYTYIPYVIAGYTVIDEYLEINDLKVVAWIYSIPKIPFPIFELEESESKQLLAAVNLEWKSSRIQLDLMCEINGTLNWQRISAFSLLNPDPYPYREYSLGSHTLGNNAMIGLQIRNVGFGLLQNSVRGQDKVTCYADLKRIITIEKPDNPPVIINLSGIAVPDPTPDPDPDPTLDPDPTPNPDGEEEMAIQIKSADYQLINRDRIFAKIDVTNTTFTLYLPENPVEGYEVELISSRNYQSQKVNVFAANNVHVFGGVRAKGVVFMDDSHRGGKLLYTNDGGWDIYPNSGAKFNTYDPNADF